MPDESWMRETMWDLRTDSPYYWEMQETLREHYREMDLIAADERMDAYLDSLEFDDDEDDDDDPRYDPRFF